MDTSRFFGPTLTDEDRHVLSTWFNMYTDTPLTANEIMAMSPNALTEAIIVVAGKEGKIDNVLFANWLHNISYSGTYKYVLNQHQRPNGEYAWTVTPYVFNLLRRLLAPIRSIVSSRFSN